MRKEHDCWKSDREYRFDRKQDNLVGSKFMIVEPVAVKGGEPGGSLKGEYEQIIAIDNIGAGIGEYVLGGQGRKRGPHRMRCAGGACGRCHRGNCGLYRKVGLDDDGNCQTE